MQAFIVLPELVPGEGIYFFSHAIVEYLPQKGAIEKAAFPVLAQKRLLKAFRLNKNERWLTINSVKDLSVAEREFASIRRL